MGWIEYGPTRQPRWMSGTMGAAWDEGHNIIADVIADSARQAVAARFAGVGPDDALPFTAAERSLEQMPGESNDTLRARLVGAWDAWTWCGTDKGVVDNIVPTGLVNVFSFDYWAWPDGNAAEWARFWIVIDQPHPWVSDGIWDDPGFWDDPNATWDSSATVDEVQRVLRQIRTWKASHAKCVYAIVIISGELWDYPSGTWDDPGTWSDLGDVVYWQP